MLIVLCSVYKNLSNLKKKSINLYFFKFSKIIESVKNFILHYFFTSNKSPSLYVIVKIKLEMLYDLREKIYV